MFSTRRQKGGVGREGVWRFGALAAIGLPVTTFALAAQQETADLLAASYRHNARVIASNFTPDDLRRSAPLYALKLRFTETDAKGNERVLAEPRLIVEEGRTAEFRAGGGVPVVARAGPLEYDFIGPSVDVTIRRDLDSRVFVEGRIETGSLQSDNRKTDVTRRAQSGITFTERVRLNEPLTWSFPTVPRSGPGVMVTNRGTTFVQLTITHANRGPPVRGPPVAGES